MSDDFKSFRCQSGFSSPSRDAAETAADQCDPLTAGPEQARDVAHRREGEKTETGDALGRARSATGGSRARTTDTR